MNKMTFPKRGMMLAVCAALVFTLIFALAVEPASAASYKKPKVIKVNKTYKINIAGSKAKEKVRVERKKVSADKFYGYVDKYAFVYKYTLRINGKKVATKRSAIGGDARWRFYYADLNTKDKFKEILIQRQPQDVSTPSTYIYRYKGKKLKPMSGTFKIPEITSPYYKTTFKKSKYVPGYAAVIRIYKNGEFRTKVIIDYNGPVTYKRIVFKMSKTGKVTRKDKPNA
jgi:hypothetical protein